MKKIISIIAAVLMILALTACGNSSTGTGDVPDDAGDQKDAAIEQDVEELERIFSATIDEVVLVDEKDVKITAKELTYTSYSADLELFIENNSDRELSFYAGTMGYSINSVNHYMIADGYVGEDVAAGMQANVTMSFDLDQLMIYGISDIADIGLGFEIKDGYDDYLVTGPLEIKTSIADSYDYDKDTFRQAMDGKALAREYGFTIDYRGDEKLFDEQGMTILSEYVFTNEDGEQALLLEVINQSDLTRYAIVSESVVNGIAVSDYGDSEMVAPGMKAVLDVSFDSLLDPSHLELLGMSKYCEYASLFEVRDLEGTTLSSKDIKISFDEAISLDNFAGDTLYDANGFTVQNVGLVEDSFSYSDDLHILLLVKNDTDKPVSVDTGFNEVYVNKLKTSAIAYGQTVKSGCYALLDVELMGYDLEKNDLTLSDITEISMKLEIRDEKYYTIDEPEAVIAY